MSEIIKCAQCGKLKMFDTEGGYMNNRWFCSWGCRARFLYQTKKPTPNTNIVVLITPKPKIVCLCGSVRFRQEFDMVACQYTEKGWVVVGPHCWNHAELHSGSCDEKKRVLDELHFRKIEMSDLVYIINVNGYIGNSTNRELRHARSLKKHIKFLEGWHQICDFAMEVQAEFGLKACCHPHQENAINQCQYVNDEEHKCSWGSPCPECKTRRVRAYDPCHGALEFCLNPECGMDK